MTVGRVYHSLYGLRVNLSRRWCVRPSQILNARKLLNGTKCSLVDTQIRVLLVESRPLEVARPSVFEIVRGVPSDSNEGHMTGSILLL